MRYKPSEPVLHRTSQQRIESVRVKAKPYRVLRSLDTA